MHFYTKTDRGVEPRHFVPMTSDPSRLRPSRISDMRKAAKEGEVWRPSVTSVGNVLAKHALIDWKIEQHLKQAFILTTLPVISPAFLEEYSYIQGVKRLTELEMGKAPQAGTDLHKLMEKYVLGDIADISMKDRELCGTILEVIIDKTEETLYPEWETEACFVSDLGYGGQIDLIPPGWLIDYKTKQTAEKFKPGKMAYDDHSMQLSAYREGKYPRRIMHNRPRCANVFVCLENGKIDFHEHTEKDLEKGWKLFQHALAIWKLQHDH